MLHARTLIRRHVRIDARDWSRLSSGVIRRGLSEFAQPTQPTVNEEIPIYAPIVDVKTSASSRSATSSLSSSSRLRSLPLALSSTPPPLMSHLGHLEAARFRLPSNVEMNPDFLPRYGHRWWMEQEIDAALRPYMSQMDSALKGGDSNRVFQLFQQLQKDTTIKKLHVGIFDMLIQACHKLSQPEAAVATFDSIFQHRLQPTFYTYNYLVLALMNHHDQTLAFDFLVLLHRELEAVLAQSHPASSHVDEEYIESLHFKLIHLHKEFLLKTVSLGYGYHGTREVGPELRMKESFLKGYFFERIHHFTQLFQCRSDSPVAEFTQADVVRHARSWWLMNDIYHHLLHHATDRRDLHTATQVWESYQAVREHPSVKPFRRYEYHLAMEKMTILRFQRLLSSLATISYQIDAVPYEDRDAQVDHVEAELNGWTEVDEKEKEKETFSIQRWHLLRNEVYGEFWSYLRRLTLARQSVANGLTLDAASEQYLMPALDETKPNANSNPNSERFILPTSQFVERVLAHAQEPIDPDDVTPKGPTEVYHPPPVKRPTHAPTAGSSDMTSIDTLVNSLYQQNLELQRAKADSSSALQSIESRRRTQAEYGSNLDYHAEIEFSEEPASHDESEAKSSAEEKSNETTLASASGLSDAQLLALSKDRRMKAKRVVKKPTGALTSDLLSSSTPASTLALASARTRALAPILPPIPPSLWNDHTATAISITYRMILGPLLMRGGGTRSGRVTPNGYRRNQELIHALYYDYLALDLPRIDPRILMLAHLSHAPPEFHVTILQSGEWIAPTGTGGLVQTLFQPWLMSPPKRYRTAETALELHAERLDWFNKAWSAYHVHPWSVAARGSDLAFRKRTYMLLDELGRRGIPLQSTRDGLLHFIIRCLCFSSYASRPDGMSSLQRSFHWRRQNLYEGHLVNLRRVLRILTGMMLHQGVHPDVKIMNELIRACLMHRRLAEAHALLQHMRQVFHLQPDHETMRLFLEEKHTPKDAKVSRKMLLEIENNLNELIVAQPTGNGVEFTTSRSQVEVFNQLLNQYLIANDDGQGMLRVHERLFELGLPPNGRTLSLSLDILLRNPNSTSLARGRELFAHALSSTPKELQSDGPLAKFIETMERERQLAKHEKLRATEERDRHRRTDKTMPSLHIDFRKDLGRSMPNSSYDSTASPLSYNYAIPFTYSSWFNIYVTASSWARLIEAAESMNSFVDCWSIFLSYIDHLTSLPRDDLRRNLYLNKDRLNIFTSVLRSLIQHTRHMDPAQQLWYFKQLYSMMTMFYTIVPVTRSRYGGSITTNDELITVPQSAQFSLDYDELHWSLLPSELRQLRYWESGLLRSHRTMIPPNESENEKKINVMRCKLQLHPSQVELIQEKTNKIADAVISGKIAGETNKSGDRKEAQTRMDFL